MGIQSGRQLHEISDFASLLRNNDIVNKLACSKVFKPSSAGTQKKRYGKSQSKISNRMHCKMFSNMNVKNDAELLKVENIKLKSENIRLKLRLQNSNETPCTVMKLFEKTRKKNDKLRKKLRKRRNEDKMRSDNIKSAQKYHVNTTDDIINLMTDQYKVHLQKSQHMSSQLETTNYELNTISKTVKKLEMENKEIQHALNLEIISH